jgi:catechol 2,3-dioxygenase-like lactoylglutathione lyase family enzyme
LEDIRDMSIIPARIDAITLASSRFRETVDFYDDVFGFEKHSESDIVARFRLQNIFLDIIKADVLLGETHLERFGTLPGPTTLAISVRAPEDVDEFMRRMKAAGVPIVAPAEDKPSGPRILYASDPEGHMWEIGYFPAAD